MRKFVFAALALVACAPPPAQSPPITTPPADAVELIPGNYGVIFENEYVRAVEHRIDGGTREPMHSHPYPRVLYAVNNSRVRIWNGDARVLESKAGDATFREPQVHAIENIGRDEAEFLMVELKKPAPVGDFVVQDDDGTRVAADTYHLLLENDRVRVIEIRSKPGVKTIMHSHPGRAFRYRMVQTQSRITNADGSVFESTNMTGPVWTEAPSRHMLENIGTTQSRTLLVEVK